MPLTCPGFSDYFNPAPLFLTRSNCRYCEAKRTSQHSLCAEGSWTSLRDDHEPRPPGRPQKGGPPFQPSHKFCVGCQPNPEPGFSNNSTNPFERTSEGPPQIAHIIQDRTPCPNLHTRDDSLSTVWPLPLFATPPSQRTGRPRDRGPLSHPELRWLEGLL